mgnify:CR=1 FL=1
MLRWAVCECTGPVAVRYPRGSEGLFQSSDFTGDPSAVVNHRRGSDAVLITYGTLINQAMEAASLLSSKGLEAAVLRLPSVTDFDPETLSGFCAGKQVFVLEEVCQGSGIKEKVSWIMAHHGIRAMVHGIDLGTDFVPHGDQESLYRLTGLDPESIAKYVCEVCGNEK